jgi:hypothetical protein
MDKIMKKLTLKQIGKAKPNPVFEGLDDSLKKPKMYIKVQKTLEKIMHSDHKHRNIQYFMKCKRCQAKVKRRDAMIKELGFKDGIQYQEWKKVMQYIINKKPIYLDEK